MGHSVAVSETSDAITVAVTFTAPPDSFLRSALVPTPNNVNSSRATLELQVDRTWLVYHPYEP